VPIGSTGVNGPRREQAKGTKEEGSQNLDGKNGGVSSSPARVGPCVLPPDEGHVGRRVLGGGAEGEQDIAGFDEEVGEGIEEEPEQGDLGGVTCGENCVGLCR